MKPIISVKHAMPKSCKNTQSTFLEINMPLVSAEC